MKCTVKHTTYQPPNNEWRCPKCGANNGDFIIEESFGNNYCNLIHNQDICKCYKCKYVATGAIVVKELAKQYKHPLELCPTCKGQGYITISIKGN